jgi:uroporphyrinogen-III decarboxylase
VVEIITIGISSDEIRQRTERVARARRFQTVDVVPAYPNLYVRYWLPKIGGSFAEYFTDAEAMLRYQILGQKWVLENVQSDLVFNPIAVDFQNAREAGTFGCEVKYPDDDIIWAGEGWLRGEDDLALLRQIDPISCGLQGKALQFAERMRSLADRYIVRFGDGVELKPAAQPLLPAGTMGPFTVAAQLMGMTDIYLDLYERPQFVQQVMGIVTDNIIAWLDYCRKVQPMAMLRLADDSAGNLSEKQFREFVLPHLQRIRDHFSGLHFWFHMCGAVDHLVTVLVNDLQIREFGMFGYELDKRRLQETAGGRVVLVGNVSPVNIHSGNVQTVMSEAAQALDVFGRGRGGFILSDGANIAPDSPVENVSALWQASRQFGQRDR